MKKLESSIKEVCQKEGLVVGHFTAFDTLSGDRLHPDCYDGEGLRAAIREIKERAKNFSIQSVYISMYAKNSGCFKGCRVFSLV